MDVQVVIDLLLDEVADILVDAVTAWSHLCGAQLDLGLTFKDWFLYVDGDGGNQSVANVAILVFAKKLFDGPGNMFLEGTLVSSAPSGMLTADKGVVPSPYWLAWVKAISMSSPFMWMMG